MSDELKPCPFCGGPADMEEIKSGFYISWSVGCRSIDGPDECIGQQSLLSFARKSEAIAAWNRRAPMTAPTPAGEEMEKLLERAREIAADDVSAMTASWVDTQAFARALLSSLRVDGITAQCAIDEVENAFLAAACKDFELLRDIRKRLRALSPPAKDPSHG